MFAPMVTVTQFPERYGHKVINLIQQPHTLGHLFLAQAVRVYAFFFAFHIPGYFQMTENEGNAPLLSSDGM